MAELSDLIGIKLRKKQDEQTSAVDRVAVTTMLTDYLEEAFSNTELVQVTFEIPESSAAEFIDIIGDRQITSKYDIQQLDVTLFIAKMKEVDLF